MHISYKRGGGTSLLRLKGNESVAMTHQDASYCLLRTNVPPSTDINAYDRYLMKMEVANVNVQGILPLLYTHLQPKPSVIREKYKKYLNGPSTTIPTPATADY